MTEFDRQRRAAVAPAWEDSAARSVPCRYDGERRDGRTARPGRPGMKQRQVAGEWGRSPRTRRKHRQAGARLVARSPTRSTRRPRHGPLTATAMVDACDSTKSIPRRRRRCRCLDQMQGQRHAARPTNGMRTTSAAQGSAPAGPPRTPHTLAGKPPCPPPQWLPRAALSRARQLRPDGRSVCGVASARNTVLSGAGAGHFSRRIPCCSGLSATVTCVRVPVCRRFGAMTAPVQTASPGAESLPEARRWQRLQRAPAGPRAPAG